MLARGRPELLDITSVMDATTLSKQHIYFLEREGLFPRKVKLGRRSAWVRTEVYAWIESRMAARPDNAHGSSSQCVQSRDALGRFEKAAETDSLTRQQYITSPVLVLCERYADENS